jgi:hypothetical protein
MFLPSSLFPRYAVRELRAFFVWHISTPVQRRFLFFSGPNFRSFFFLSFIAPNLNVSTFCNFRCRILIPRLRYSNVVRSHRPCTSAQRRTASKHSVATAVPTRIQRKSVVRTSAHFDTVTKFTSRGNFRSANRAETGKRTWPTDRS